MISRPSYKADVNSPVFFIAILKGYKRYLSRQEFSTIKGQALAGDVTGAKKGLERLLRKKGVFDAEERI